jgi:gluconolactonase
LTEGLLWVKPSDNPGGHLLFSDPNSNVICRYDEKEGLSVFRMKSGYTGADITEYFQPGSNGITLDSQGRITVNEHGNRRVTRTEQDGSLTVLADRFEGCPGPRIAQRGSGGDGVTAAMPTARHCT